MKTISFSQKAFIVHENRILMIQKSSEDPDHPLEWEVPGGRIKFGEKLDEHIKREVMEEVGIEIEPLDPFYMWTWLMSDELDVTQVIAIGRVCEARSFSVTPRYQCGDDYISRIEWIEKDKVLALPIIQGAREAMVKFLSLKEWQIKDECI